MPPVHENPRVLSKPGEIRREYEEELRKFEEQLKLEREQEETASRLCIEKMLKIDAAQKQIEEEDKIITRQIKVSYSFSKFGTKFSGRWKYIIVFLSVYSYKLTKSHIQYI